MKKYMSAKAVLLLVCFTFLCFKPLQEKTTIYSIGDSTMSNYPIEDGYPLRGWMMMIAPMFKEGVAINNAASSGRSSKSFRDEGRWKKVIDQVKKGDYVFIQFGHNDAKTDTARHTDAPTTFRQNLLDYVLQTKAKGAQPVLFTSIVRRKFDRNGMLQDTHGEYVTVVRKLAAELKIPLVDLNKKFGDLVQALGPEESKKLFLYVEPKQFERAPDGKKDDTHLCVYGATKVAALAIEGLKETGLPLAKFIR